MNILPNSDIQGVNNRIYLNNPELKDGKSGTNLFYSSPYSKQYYFIMRGYEVIANGVMNGYLENGEYLYRFDFVNFIKIINQEEPVFYRLDNGSYKFTGNNSIDLYMYMSNTELLQTNISNERLIVLPNGSVVLNSATYTYLDIVSANHCFTSFIDAGDTIYDQEGYELQYRRETVVVGQKGSYLPITVYRNNILIYMFKDAEGNIIYQSSPLQRGPDISMPGLNDGYILTESDGYMLSEINSLISLEGGMDTVLSFKNGYVVYMILIPENATSISYYIYSNGGSSSMNIYGYNLIANSQFLKFDSQPNTQDSILMKDEGEWYYKAIPTTGNRVVIDGANYNTIAGQMYSSGLWVRSNIATTASISRQANMLDSERVFNLVANVWTYIYTNAVIGNAQKLTEVSLGTNNAILSYKKAKVQKGLATNWIPNIMDVNKTNITYNEFKLTDGCMKPYYFWNDNGAYDTIYCSGTRNELVNVDKKYIMVNGVKIPIKITSNTKIRHNTGLAIKQEQIYSLIKSPNVNAITNTIDGPVNDILNIDNESFEGFNGMNLSERNLELIFSKPKNVRRITDKEIKFFD